MSHMPSGFQSVAFSGSRALTGDLGETVAKLARAAYRSGFPVLTGCAAGSDAFVRAAVPSAQVFEVASGLYGRGRAAYAKRSIAMVNALGELPYPILIAAPVGDCPEALSPSDKGRECFGGFGTGTWSSAAYALGSGIPVFLPDGITPPHWGSWSPFMLAGVSGMIARP